MYKEIQNKIYKGLKNTCKDGILFNGEFYAEIKPEYLIGVNIAQALGELNIYPGSPLIIRLEEPTEDFATRCVPDMSWEDTEKGFEVFAPTIFRTRHNTDRNGRFDIGLYTEDKENPITAIEFKLVNPTKDGISDDIKRLSEILHLVDTTGNTKVKYTYFACIELNEKIKFDTEVKANLKTVKQKYTDWLNELTDEKTDFDIATLNIDDSLILTPQKITGDDIFDGDQYSQAKHFVGVIIRLKKKN